MMLANGKLSLGKQEFMELLGVMFACYAILGRKSLPRFLTRKIGD